MWIFFSLFDEFCGLNYKLEGLCYFIWFGVGVDFFFGKIWVWIFFVFVKCFLKYIDLIFFLDVINYKFYIRNLIFVIGKEKYIM